MIPVLEDWYINTRTIWMNCTWSKVLLVSNSHRLAMDEMSTWMDKASIIMLPFGVSWNLYDLFQRIFSSYGFGLIVTLTVMVLPYILFWLVGRSQSIMIISTSAQKCEHVTELLLDEAHRCPTKKSYPLLSTHPSYSLERSTCSWLDPSKGKVSHLTLFLTFHSRRRLHYAWKWRRLKRQDTTVNEK